MMPCNIQALEMDTFWPEVSQGQVSQKHAVLLKGQISSKACWKRISTGGQQC